jgi:hypothetical protein
MTLTSAKTVFFLSFLLNFCCFTHFQPLSRLQNVAVLQNRTVDLATIKLDEKKHNFLTGFFANFLFRFGSPPFREGEEPSGFVFLRGDHSKRFFWHY